MKTPIIHIQVSVFVGRVLMAARREQICIPALYSGRRWPRERRQKSGERNAWGALRELMNCARPLEAAPCWFVVENINSDDNNNEH